jgi:hypothetical protein
MPDSLVLPPAILGAAMPSGAALGPLRQPTVSLQPRHHRPTSRYLSYGTSQIERRFSFCNSIGCVTTRVARAAFAALD